MTATLFDVSKEGKKAVESAVANANSGDDQERKRAALFAQWYDGTGEREGAPYPRRGDRGRALVIFHRKITTKKRWAVLCMKTDLYRKEVSGKPKELIKHAKTFLQAFSLEDAKDFDAQTQELEAESKLPTPAGAVRCYECHDLGVVWLRTVMTFRHDGGRARVVAAFLYDPTKHAELKLDPCLQRCYPMPWRCPCGRETIIKHMRGEQPSREFVKRYRHLA